MGFFEDVLEDVFGSAEKIIKSPLRVYCAVDEHDWKYYESDKMKCTTCGATKKR